MRTLPKMFAAVAALTLPFTAFSEHHDKREVPLMNKLIVLSLAAAEDKVLQLAEAIPEENYDYAPMEGVSDVGEVLMHLAGANYFIASMLGEPMPEGLDPRTLGVNTDKAEKIMIYQDSVKFAKQTIKSVSAEALEEDIEFFGTTMPRARVALIVADHQHEHLGQLIAYARANEIVPPWSQ